MGIEYALALGGELYELGKLYVTLPLDRLHEMSPEAIRDLLVVELDDFDPDGYPLAVAREIVGFIAGRPGVRHVNDCDDSLADAEDAGARYVGSRYVCTVCGEMSSPRLPVGGGVVLCRAHLATCGTSHGLAPDEFFAWLERIKAEREAAAKKAEET